jgi:hypothetical protein
MENNSYNQYPPRFIHTILKQYKMGVRGSGFKALASRYNIKGGHKLISAWYAKWDGTIYSLTKQSGGDRRSILTPEEKKKYVYDFIVKKSKSEAATYQEVQKNVEKKTGKAPKPRTIRDYGEAAKITSKKRKRVLKSQGMKKPLFLAFLAFPPFPNTHIFFAI